MVNEQIDCQKFNIGQLGNNVAYLDISNERDNSFLSSLRNKFLQENHGKLKFGRVVDHENILIPDITIMQNISFYSNFHGINSTNLLNYITSEFPDIKQYLQQKRASLSLVEWCGIGLIVYLAIPQNFYFINLTLHQFSDTKFKPIICNIIEQSIGSSIVIYSHPHGIQNIKDFVGNFIVKNNSDISSIINLNNAIKIINNEKL